MLIFVGWLPPYLYPSRCLPRSRHEDLSQPHNVHEGCTHHRGCVSSAGRCRSWFGRPHQRLRGDRPHFRDRPHKGRELARDGGRYGVRVLAPREQLAVAPAEAELRPPRDVANDRGQMFLAGLDLLGDLGPIAIGLGRFDQHPARMAVAGLGDATEPAPLPAGVLARGEAEIAHDLPGGLEAGEVAELRIVVMATVNCTPRRACRASTTGDRRQVLACSRSSASRRCSSSVRSVTVRTYSWKTICWAGVGKTKRASQRRCSAAQFARPT